MVKNWVLTPGILDRPLSYSHDIQLDVGQLVTISVRNKEYVGVIKHDTAIHFEGVCKPISKVLRYRLPISLLKFIDDFGSYVLAPKGYVLKHVLSLAVEKMVEDFPIPPLHYENHLKILNPDQQVIVDQLKVKEFSCIFIDGVTGSGKTEVYFHLAQKILNQGQQVLILIPEIALTAQLLKRFEDAFGISACVWHSRFQKKDRKLTWHRAIQGHPMVVLGARSALFLPFQNLGLIIVDEEHDPSFKQDTQLIYNARDMAVLRAKCEQCPIYLGSATPCLETYINAKEGKYQYFPLKNRFNASMASIVLVQDRSSHLMSPSLMMAIHERLKKKEQVLLYINRRGYAPVVMCQECRCRIFCKRCSVSLVYHKKESMLLCHYCGFRYDYPPTCTRCKTQDAFIFSGVGVEQVYEEASQLFPHANIQMASSDVMKSTAHMDRFLNLLQSRECDIVIGTQILAKGHHFPHITLVGVIDADMGLSGIDFRSAEKSYHLLHQVSGRAGRGELTGEVLIQTFDPKHPLFQSLCHHNRDEFYDFECEARRAAMLPPYGRLTLITLSGRDKAMVRQHSFICFDQIPKSESLSVFGPMEAYLSPLRGQYRYQILLKYPKNFHIQLVLKRWMMVSQHSSISIHVDIDPL